MVYGDSIAYVGYGDDIASIVTLKHRRNSMQLIWIARFMSILIKSYTWESRYTIETEKRKTCNSRGQETSENFAKQVNGMQFEYGDVVKVFHAEPDRLKWHQNNTLTGQGEKKERELFFKVTEKGFERMDMLQEVTAKPQQVVVGTDVEKLDPKAFVEVKDGEVIG